MKCELKDTCKGCKYWRKLKTNKYNDYYCFYPKMTIEKIKKIIKKRIEREDKII